jgi:tetraacyldisaccharide 4'-kinase
VQVSNNTAKNIEKWLQSAWYKPTLLSFILLIALWPLSLVYRFLAFTHKTLYTSGVFKTHKVSVPVIVVGNIVTGGGGKTPTVIALVQHLQAQGIKVGVISRGYGRTSSECLEVKKDSKISDVGDEPAGVLLALDSLACSAPIFVAKKRYDAASALLKTYPDTQVIISDDGLQHHALQHDIAITVFDDRGIGNGMLLPAGPLRESKVPTHHSLVLHTGNQAIKLTNTATPQFAASRALASYALRSDGRQVSLNALKSTSAPLLAVAGIANPEAFFDMLREAGLHLADTLALPDHYDFNYDFNSTLGNKYAGYSVICTVKDAVKLWQTPQQQFSEVLAIPLDFAPEPAFFAAFDAMLKPYLKLTQSTKSPT